MPELKCGPRGGHHFGCWCFPDGSRSLLHAFLSNLAAPLLSIPTLIQERSLALHDAGFLFSMILFHMLKYTKICFSCAAFYGRLTEEGFLVPYFPTCSRKNAPGQR